MTPEKMAALEAAAAATTSEADAVLESMLTPARTATPMRPARLDEAVSPVVGRRFSRG